MKRSWIGYSACACLAVTILWLVLLIVDAVRFPALDPFSKSRLLISRGDFIYYATYINAALITLLATVFMAGLYQHCKQIAPLPALIGLLFVPVYACFNLFVYLSQVLMVPRLMTLTGSVSVGTAYGEMVRQMLQSQEGSIVSLLNCLAYAILAIPSVLFGLILARLNSLTIMGGVLLILNGVACVLGLIGAASCIRPLATFGTMAGGILFLLALAFLSVAFLRAELVARQQSDFS